MTYDRLDDVGKIIGGSKDDGPLLGIVGADFVDPTQDQGTPASLGRQDSQRQCVFRNRQSNEQQGEEEEVRTPM